jgi:hypothetical protein
MDARCDRSAESPSLPEASEGTLSIEVVDHTAAGHDVPGRLSIDGSKEDGGTGLEPDPGTPRVETLLRRIFDDTQLRTPALSESAETDERSAPLAIDESESADAPVSESTDPENGAAETVVPSVSRDDLVRFKRQMYRTDI